jgi:hypothetical protein
MTDSGSARCKYSRAASERERFFRRERIANLVVAGRGVVRDAIEIVALEEPATGSAEEDSPLAFAFAARRDMGAFLARARASPRTVRSEVPPPSCQKWEPFPRLTP